MDSQSGDLEYGTVNSCSTLFLQQAVGTTTKTTIQWGCSYWSVGNSVATWCCFNNRKGWLLLEKNMLVWCCVGNGNKSDNGRRGEWETRNNFSIRGNVDPLFWEQNWQRTYRILFRIKDVKELGLEQSLKVLHGQQSLKDFYTILKHDVYIWHVGLFQK